MSKFAGLQLTLDQPARMTIISPNTGAPLVDDEGNPAYIDILSAESQAARDFDKKAIDARLQGKTGAATYETAQAEIAGRIAALVKGWHLVDLETLAPLDLPCEAENVEGIFSTPSWLREQVQNFLFNRVNFAPRSSKA